MKPTKLSKPGSLRRMQTIIEHRCHASAHDAISSCSADGALRTRATIAWNVTPYRTRSDLRDEITTRILR